ncbi:hypothetical protein D3C72_1803140 [compost metagenome]
MESLHAIGAGGQVEHRLALARRHIDLRHSRRGPALVGGLGVIEGDHDRAGFGAGLEGQGQTVVCRLGEGRSGEGQNGGDGEGADHGGVLSGTDEEVVAFLPCSAGPRQRPCVLDRRAFANDHRRPFAKRQ